MSFTEIDKQVCEGAKKLIATAAYSSGESSAEPIMAIAQLLMAAAQIAHVLGMEKKAFKEGVELAWHNGGPIVNDGG